MKQQANRLADRRILVIDDEADIRELLEMTLIKMGVSVDSLATISAAKERLANQAYDLCLTDMRLPDGEGLDLVQYIAQHYPQLPTAVITAYGSMENAVAAFKVGAFDYLAKPVRLDQLRALVKTVLDLPRTQPAVASTQALLGQSAVMQQVRETIAKLARSQAPVYLTGESGCGKELAARLIHEQSARRDQPFVAVNCGAIPESLVESEFFGYKKGAFTGADSDREGFFQAANGGTLFLDEVADLPLSMQVKLLRAIQEKKVRKVGATAEEPVDVRILSATHQKLSQCVEERRFRQDLYYRLNVIELRMPSLREMPEDIPYLAEALLGRLAASEGGTAPRLTPEAVTALQHYAFPGNVRELENILERAMALSDGAVIDTADLQLDVDAALLGRPEPGDKWPLQEYIDRLEREAILEALEKCRHNKTAAAKLLGITFRSLRYRLERLGIE